MPASEGLTVIQGKRRGRPADAPVEQQWLSVRQVATILGVSTDTVYAWIHSLALPAFMVRGGDWRVSRTALDRWMRQQEGVEPLSEPVRRTTRRTSSR